MTRITFSDGHSVTGYNDIVGPALGLVGIAVERENTLGKPEWVNLSELTELVKDMLPPDVKGKADDAYIRARIQAAPDGLTHVQDVVQSIASQLRRLP